MDHGLIITFAGVTVAGLAGILGVWMERDRGAPITSGLVFTGIIVIATGIEAFHAVGSTAEQAETDAQLATILEAMGELAAKGDNPALEQFVGAELAVQARANPDVVSRMEESVAAKGGDPSSVTKRASQGRRSAAGLAPEPPKEGERPQLSASMKSHAVATGHPMAASIAPAAAVPSAEAVLDDVLDAATPAAAVAGAKEAGAKAVEDVMGAGTQAIDDGKAAAEAAAAEAKAKADAAAAQATQAAADAEAAARAEADKVKAEADAAKAEAEAKKKAAEDAAAKQKAAADKKKKEAEKAKKEAEAKADKAKDIFGR